MRNSIKYNDLLKYLRSQLDIDVFGHLHFKYKSYEDIIHKLNFADKNFQQIYNQFVDKNLKIDFGINRMIVSRIPTVVCSLPNHSIYHLISHPFTKNTTSVFVSFTSWYDPHTITVLKKNHKSLPLDSENIYTIISDTDRIRMPTGINNSFNSSFGLFFCCMSWDTYKSNGFQQSFPIGDYFSLV